MPKKAPPAAYPLRVITPASAAQAFSGLPQRAHTEPIIKRRYSVTADILSYRRCKRQYGFFNRRKYSSAQAGQLFFGTVIHETLDRAHAHYRGEIVGVPPGLMPTKQDIEAYFQVAAEVLKKRGIRPMSNDSRDKALEYVQNFNTDHGPIAYPRIIDTEHRLQKDKGDYILHGVVDVVAGKAGAVQAKDRWEDYEIWDYKGSKRPTTSREMENYEFQMRVYSHLYKERNGRAPKRAVLWFLGEASKKQEVEVDINEKIIQLAVHEFEGTVQDIEKSIKEDNWSQLTRADKPDEATCDACDLRWKCSALPRPYPLRGLSSS